MKHFETDSDGQNTNDLPVFQEMISQFLLLFLLFACAGMQCV